MKAKTICHICKYSISNLSSATYTIKGAAHGKCLQNNHNFNLMLFNAFDYEN